MSEGRDIVVMGASAGGLSAARRLVAGLPADLPAALFLVMHLSADSPSALPHILGRSGKLPASHARNGEGIERGRIYIAPPNRHMLLSEGVVHLSLGPKENHTRPAIDPLFRSAAFHYGPRVIGMVLSGLLDDGTAGLVAVKSRGGLSLVQDPNDAEYDGMPRSAIAGDTPDHIVAMAEMPDLLVRLVNEPAPDPAAYPVPRWLEVEAHMTEEEAAMSSIEGLEKLGEPSTFVCPECKGALFEVEDGKLLRFRCHVGHAYSAASLQANQNEDVESAMWVALRALRESAELSRRLAKRAAAQGNPRAALAHRQEADARERHAELIRAAIGGERQRARRLARE